MDPYELARQATAKIHEWPRLPWWRLLARRRCTHLEVLCVHGDGIALLRARGVCMDCGRRFRELPPVCAFTGQPHPSNQLPWEEP